MMKYFILITLVLLFVGSFAFAHVGEPEEQHSDEVTNSGMMTEEMVPEQSLVERKDICPFVFGGILIIGLAVFFIWNLIKK